MYVLSLLNGSVQIKKQIIYFTIKKTWLTITIVMDGLKIGTSYIIRLRLSTPKTDCRLMLVLLSGVNLSNGFRLKVPCNKSIHYLSIRIRTFPSAEIGWPNPRRQIERGVPAVRLRASARMICDVPRMALQPAPWLAGGLYNQQCLNQTGPQIVFTTPSNWFWNTRTHPAQYNNISSKQPEVHLFKTRVATKSRPAMNHDCTRYMNVRVISLSPGDRSTDTFAHSLRLANLKRVLSERKSHRPAAASPHA